jgi:hypothetical protein
LFLSLFPVVLSLEFFHPTRSIDIFHFAGEKRVASGTDFDRNALSRAPRNKLVAAAARHGRFDVLGMDAGFHDLSCSSRMKHHCKKEPTAGKEEGRYSAA